MTDEQRKLTSDPELLAPPKLLGASKDPNPNSVGSAPIIRLYKLNELVERDACHQSFLP